MDFKEHIYREVNMYNSTFETTKGSGNWKLETREYRLKEGEWYIPNQDPRDVGKTEGKTGWHSILEKGRANDRGHVCRCAWFLLTREWKVRLRIIGELKKKLRYIKNKGSFNLTSSA